MYENCVNDYVLKFNDINNNHSFSSNYDLLFLLVSNEATIRLLRCFVIAKTGKLITLYPDELSKMFLFHVKVTLIAQNSSFLDPLAPYHVSYMYANFCVFFKMYENVSVTDLQHIFRSCCASYL